ncbi:MAG: helix-turn-helix domain-containing protein [Oscillospiraceae bacterium]|nr:helix-turn-helix domain-containing protein [Oscillospiraceae bacterium]
MEIGSRLKNARNEHGLTQEQVAEELGVSRQSISNWENNRSYPDIISVIRMSDLYSVSLDELLKEDKKMIRHLAETTDAVAKDRRFVKWLLLGVYAAIWVLFITFFWLVDSDDLPECIWDLKDLINAEREVYLFFFPLCTGMITLLIGAGGHFGMWKWLFIPINGIMCILSCGVMWELYWHLSHLHTKEYMTKTEQPFILLDFLKEYLSKTEWYEKGAPLVGIAAAAIGLFIGSFIRYFRLYNATRTKDKTDDKAFLQENSPL